MSRVPAGGSMKPEVTDLILPSAIRTLWPHFGGSPGVASTLPAWMTVSWVCIALIDPFSTSRSSTQRGDPAHGMPVDTIIKAAGEGLFLEARTAIQSESGRPLLMPLF